MVNVSCVVMGIQRGIVRYGKGEIDRRLDFFRNILIFIVIKIST